MPASEIPAYSVYGEPSRSLEVGFLHVETVRQRNAVHLGHVSPHVHPQMGQVTIWTGGRGRYRIEDHSWDFCAPAASFVPGGTVHGFDIEPDADAVVISLADVLLDALARRAGLPLAGPVFASGPPSAAWRRVQAIATLALEEYQGSGTGAPAAKPVLDGLVTAALGSVLRLVGPLVGGPVSRPGPSAALSQRLREAVNAHYREDWPVGRYVEHLGTTPHLLDRAVREALGTSVKAAVTERRLLEAKRLLLFTIRTVEDVAFELGFTDPAYFSRFFRRHTGETPSAWRAREIGRPAARA